jgi:DNA replication and repair protein RecF
MSIRQLSLTDFRNLRSTTLDFNAHINLVVGDNGSGKTSLLEAIYVLCQAQSFRTHQLKQCIQHGRDSFLLFGRFADFKAGLSKSDRELNIHVNAEPVKKRSDLVRRVPINIVNADSFALIDGSPNKRREFIDWCLFHVEHEYVESWVLFRHALRQRNRLLKSRQDLNLLGYWDDHLIEPSLKIHGMRQQLCLQLQSTLSGKFDEMLNGIPVDLGFRQGWDMQLELGEALLAQRARDIQSGFTNSGIHRDDLLITSNGKKVSEHLSRGESKRLCMALLMAALKLVGDKTGKRIILLIDDLRSELDSGAQDGIYRQLGDLDLQLFISNIENTIPAPLQSKEFKMFHVEHGTIKPRNFS